ncbi:MAG: OmpA family protein, partial [Gammaproteobacteria bacterium]
AAPPPPPPPAPAPPPPPPPADGDRDGVPDSADLCPTTPAGAPVDSNGCRCDYTLSLEFGFDSAELSASDKQALNQLIGTLNRLPYVRAVVEGHTDSRGAAEYNQGLSERRAQAVVDYLHAAGIGDNQLRAVGYGESRPVASNETEEGRAANRRAVLRRTDCN